jgi:hypothetical protein
VSHPLHAELALSGFHHVKTTHGEAGETQHFKGRNGHKVMVNGDRWSSKPAGGNPTSGTGKADLSAHLGPSYHAKNPEGLGYKAMFKALMRGENTMSKEQIDEVQNASIPKVDPCANFAPQGADQGKKTGEAKTPANTGRKPEGALVQQPKAWVTKGTVNPEGGDVQNAFNHNDSVHGEAVELTVPPGMEDVLEKLKGVFSGDSSRAYQLAWDAYNKGQAKNESKAGKLLRTIVEDHDRHATHELHLHGDNTGHLYHNSEKPVRQNLEKKFKKGVYDHEKAKKLWGYHANRVAQDYTRNFGNTGGMHGSHGHFSPAVRRAYAGDKADQHLADMRAGRFHGE